MTTLQNIL